MKSPHVRLDPSQLKISLDSLKNAHIPPHQAGVKQSTNFFHTHSHTSKPPSIQYEFDAPQSGKQTLIKPLASTLKTALSHPHTAEAGKHIKRHGIPFYAALVTGIALIIAISSVVTFYSIRYREIAESYHACTDAVSFIQNQEISLEQSVSCTTAAYPLWNSEYWKAGIEYDTIVSHNNAEVARIATLLETQNTVWNNLKKNLEQEIGLYVSTKKEDITADSFIPQDNLPLGKKIANAQTQLTRFTEKNTDVAHSIQNILSDFSQKLNVYKNTISLDAYTSFYESYIAQPVSAQFAAYAQLTSTYDAFKLDVDKALQQLTLKSPESIASLLAAEYRTFSPNEMYQLYAEKSYTFVTPPTNTIDITGNAEADAYIEQKAIQRGYQRRSSAYESRLELIQGEYLQPEARKAFEQLALAASKESINIVLVSGYRSISEQKNIFNNRFVPYFSPEQIVSGQADQVLDKTLSTSSIPGFSRHHTGYTIDLGCASREITIFGNSSCYEWIQKNNFLNAKRFGFIPSYPDNVTIPQGPDPEPWEFVWVGEDLLKNNTNRAQ